MAYLLPKIRWGSVWEPLHKDSTSLGVSESPKRWRFVSLRLSFDFLVAARELS